MLSFTEFVSIQESFNIEDDKLVLKSSDGIKSSFGKGKNLKPFTKKVLGDDLISYSLYQANTTNSTDILKAFKTADYSTKELQDFLTRSAIYAVKVLREIGVDVIVTPVSSSNLTKEFVNKIIERTNYDVYIDSFRKSPDISKVKIDTNHPGITDDIVKSMKSILDRAIKRGNLSVKMFAVHHRKFLTNMFEVTDERLLQKINGKSVVIIDDIMTSGTTTKNIYDILITNGADKVSALTIFKSS